METKIKPRNRITDFKNDLVFKFMLSDLNDSRCYYLLKVIIEGITGIKCQELFVLNSEVNPEHLSDKDMSLDVRVKTDEGKLIDIEMQNSALTKEVHYRFQIYGARMMDHQVNRGDKKYSENLHKVVTILFIDDIDKDNLELIDAYMHRNRHEYVWRFNLIESYFVQLPFIKVIEKERGITIYSKNCSVRYKDYKINIVDTPGHADFSSEVERIIKTVDTVVLIVDSKEGPMPQTRFVLDKALKQNLNPILFINKIDKKDARIDDVVNMTFDLFCELGANEKQLDFPICYGSARDGIAKYEVEDDNKDITPLLDTIFKHTSSYEGNEQDPVQMQISS